MANNRARAQASLEYAAVIALLLAVSLPLWMFVNDRLATARREIDASTADRTVRAIAQSADWVYLQGFPARRTVEVELPDSVESYGVSGREVLLRLAVPGGTSEIYAVAMANLTGELPSRPGRAFILVSSVEGNPGTVNVSAVG